MEYFQIKDTIRASGPESAAEQALIAVDAMRAMFGLSWLWDFGDVLSRKPVVRTEKAFTAWHQWYLANVDSTATDLRELEGDQADSVVATLIEKHQTEPAAAMLLFAFMRS